MSQKPFTIARSTALTGPRPSRTPIAISGRAFTVSLERLSQTSVQGSGPNGRSVNITWSIIFKDAAVMNNYKQFLLITDDSGFNTGFDKVGGWSVVR